MNKINRDILSPDQMIAVLAQLGQYLSEKDERLDAYVHRTSVTNPWFTKENIYQAIDNVVHAFLDADELTNWIGRYQPVYPEKPLDIGLVMAGNIPLVGFHDLICVLVSGNRAQIKLSENDKYLIPFLQKKLEEIKPSVAQRIRIVDRLKNFDAVIATGSDNAAMHFASYFAQYPHIIRKNRNAIAVLNGTETAEELRNLGRDVFHYFGLGCRNVSKIYVPKDYNFESLLESFSLYRHLAEHTKYRNNLDYNAAIYILNKVPHFSIPNLMLLEDDNIISRIGCLHYSYYQDIKLVEVELAERHDEIQCVVSKIDTLGTGAVPFGQTQKPSLTDYADGVDTMQFLTTLSAARA